MPLHTCLCRVLTLYAPVQCLEVRSFAFFMIDGPFYRGLL